jgi:hypothetical protein
MTMRKLGQVQLVLVDFANAWETRFGSRYLIDWKSEMPYAVKLCEFQLQPDEYAERRRIYFDDAKWWDMCKCGFRAFVQNVNKFVPPPHLVRTMPAGDPYIQCSACDSIHRSSERCKVTT